MVLSSLGEVFWLGLRVRDAVPLSKSVVFIGSIASLFLNLRRSKAIARL